MSGLHRCWSPSSAFRRSASAHGQSAEWEPALRSSKAAAAHALVTLLAPWLRCNLSLLCCWEEPIRCKGSSQQRELGWVILSFPGSSERKASACNMGRPGFDPWVWKIRWRRKWPPTPVPLPGKSHGWRSLVGYRPWGHKELDMTEQLHFFFPAYLPKNPMNRGAWCATV